MKNSAVLFFTLFFISTISPQPVSDWKNYADKSSVADITVSGNYLWAATGGGAFGWNLTDSTFITINKTDGLQSIILTSVTADNYGKIWFGSSNGIISVYEPLTGTIKSILDIYISVQVNKKINELKVLGDTIIAATDFGISLIDCKSYVFLDTYFRFGDFTSFIPVNSAFKKDVFYLATQSGAAIQKQNTTNLSAPESWNVFRRVNGLPDDNVRGIVSYNDSIIAATDRGMAVFNGISWESFQPQIINAVSKIYVNKININGVEEDVMLFINNNIIYQYYRGFITEFFASIHIKNTMKYFEGAGYFIATSGGVAEAADFNGENFVVPNGPRSNQFRDLSVGEDKVLWVATGADPAGVGANSFDNNEWHNYNINNSPGMAANAVYSIFAAPDNTKYFGTWGSGVVVYKNGEFIHYNAANSGMVGITNNPDYIVISGFAADSRNNLWVLNYGSADRKPLSLLTPDNQWYHFSVPSENNLYSPEHFYLQIDNYDTKWYAINSANRKGLFYFNENKTFDNPADDKSGVITTEQGLSNNSITSLAIDRRGDLWVGTSLGLTIITNSGSVLSTPQLKYFPVYLLRQQTINCIAVDALNNKWIGTNQGLLYVNSDGSGLLGAYDSQNSPLLADEIRSLAIDHSTGVVYAGTNAGLTSFKTFAVRPVEAFSELNIYPNPFRVNGGHNRIMIEGLVRDSDIKILSVSGKLIYEFSSPGGGTAEWNGRDFNGVAVSSGVYIIAAFDKEGNNVTTGKVAVFKE